MNFLSLAHEKFLKNPSFLLIQNRERVDVSFKFSSQQENDFLLCSTTVSLELLQNDT